MEHHLKTWPNFFDALWSGDKTFDVRRNDRDFEVGDTLLLGEWCPNRKCYTTRTIRAKITYIMKWADGIQHDYVVMALGDVKRFEILSDAEHD